MEFNYLNDKDLMYYSRHILLPNIGIEGQQKLNSSEVTIFGLGGLGNLLSTYIASSGIKKINLVDFDIIEETNLQRQINFSSDDIGLLKIDAIEKFLKIKHPDILVKKYYEKIISSTQAENIIINSDVVLDGTDNFEVRKIINMACLQKNKKLIIGAVEGYSGQLMSVVSNKSACYECVYENLVDNNSCSDSGVLAPLVGMISSMMAIECINIITGNKSSYENKLLIINGLTMSIDTLNTKRNLSCKENCVKAI
jgi:molybdopterin/thiamine biosynthesis adenylyltransferase|tara:strand:+ start:2691 stop:3452 length:762 start_codon:yes stop_codon:yes gene_type:complete